MFAKCEGQWGRKWSSLLPSSHPPSIRASPHPQAWLLLVDRNYLPQTTHLAVTCPSSSHLRPHLPLAPPHAVPWSGGKFTPGHPDPGEDLAASEGQISVRVESLDSNPGCCTHSPSGASVSPSVPQTPQESLTPQDLSRWRVDRYSAKTLDVTEQTLLTS